MNISVGINCGILSLWGKERPALETFDVRVIKNTSADKKKPAVYLNYVPEEEAFARPIKQLISRESLVFFTKKQNDEGYSFADSALIINLVTKSFLKETSLQDLLREADAHSIRRVSIIFDACEIADDLKELLGETILLSDLNETIGEYLLTSLYHEYPYFTMLGPVSDNVQLAIKPILADLTKPKKFRIGNEDSVILAVGSMGYSTVKMWVDQGYEIISKVVFVLKSNNADKGQPDFSPDMNKWIIEIDNYMDDDGTEHVKNMHEAVSKWLKDNDCRNIILLGGLGKTTSTLLIPTILTQAKKLGIRTTTVCTLPLEFESDRTRDMANTSLEIIKQVSDKTIYLKNLAMGCLQEDSDMSVKDIFDIFGYVIAIAINNEDFRKKDKNVMGSYTIYIAPDEFSGEGGSPWNTPFGSIMVTII
jgi:hypothetical protein